MTSKKRLSALLSSLEAQGCTVRVTTCGWWIGFPDGGSASLHRTPSDHRAEMNFRAIVRRHGLKWPFA